jgi:hypothetical protein
MILSGDSEANNGVFRPKMRFRYAGDRKKRERSAVVRVGGKSAAEVVAEARRQRADAGTGGPFLKSAR